MVESIGEVDVPARQGVRNAIHVITRHRIGQPIRTGSDRMVREIPALRSRSAPAVLPISWISAASDRMAMAWYVLEYHLE